MLLEINLLGLLFFAGYAFGGCGVCQKNFMACNSENTFSLCIEGKPTNSIISCPEGKVCTDDPAVCISRDAMVVPSCVLSRLPMENEQLNEIEDQTNDLDSISIDASINDTTLTTEVSYSSSTNTPRDAAAFCSENEEVGTFSAEGDISCKRYFVCTKSNDGFKGYEFDCGKNYFNSTIGLCQKEKPVDCQ